MSQVETVRRPVPVDALGQVLMHEHVFILGTEIRQNFPNYPDTWDEEARLAEAVTKLNECAGRGVRTIVDPTVIGLGRYILGASGSTSRSTSTSSNQPASTPTR